MIRAKVIGCGSYLPEKIVTNHDLEARVETSHDWIVQRTGIEQRHVAAEGETTVDLAEKAARDALAHAGLKDGNDIDAIIMGTTTPDMVFPASAALLQARLGMPPSGFAFDVQAVCSGFIYGFSIANSLIQTGQAKRILVVGAETLSKIVDWDDRGTCILFGDGAGAVILEACEGKGTLEDRGILSTHLHSEGQLAEMLYANSNSRYSHLDMSGTIRMEGQEVFKHAVNRLAEVVDETLAHNGLQKEDIDFLVPHQANKRIIEATARKLNLTPEQVILTVHKHGNTSAASIPLALHEGVKKNIYKPGDLLLLEAMGGGLTWGAALLRW